MILRRKYPNLHLEVQKHILSLLPLGEAFLEYKMANHIADVVWLKQSIVFEIQCSNLSIETAQNRIKDYNALGFSVVWILHQKTFNHKRVKPLERFLHTECCYFTDITKTGLGKIYTQFEFIKGRIRIFRSSPFTVNIAAPCYKNQRLHFQGDLLFRQQEVNVYKNFYKPKKNLLIHLYDKGLNYLVKLASN